MNLSRYTPFRLLAIRQHRLHYLGHILRMPESRVVRCALVALAKGGTVYPKGSLFGLPYNGDGPAIGTSTATRCLECTGQTITLRWPATIPLDPLCLRRNSYIPLRSHRTISYYKCFNSYRIKGSFFNLKLPTHLIRLRYNFFM